MAPELHNLNYAPIVSAVYTAFTKTGQIIYTIKIASKEMRKARVTNTTSKQASRGHKWLPLVKRINCLTL